MPSFSQTSNSDDFPSGEQVLTATLNEARKALQALLITLDEPGTRKSLDEALGEQGRIKHQRDIVESDTKVSQQEVNNILLSRSIAYPSEYTYDGVVKCWPLIAVVSPNEEHQVAEDLDRVQKHLYAAQEQANQLAAELHHPGTPPSINVRWPFV